MWFTVAAISLCALAHGGEKGIKVSTVDFTDSSRPTPANGWAAARPERTLRTDIIYPDGPSSASGQHPVIFFVHGVGANRGQYDYLTHALAKAGYVVVAADFPLTNSWAKGGPSDAHSDEQVRDISFLMDRLTDPANAKQPWAPFVNSDPSHYVVAGHSTGGSVALVAGFSPDYHDPRVAGVIALAPEACFFSREFFATRAVPMAVVGATNDRYAPFPNNSLWAQRAASGPHALATLLGGNHVYMTDYCLPDWLLKPVLPMDDSALIATMSRYGSSAQCGAPPLEEAPAISCREEHAAIRSVVGAFADQMLRGDSRGVDAIRGRHGPVVVETSK